MAHDEKTPQGEQHEEVDREALREQVYAAAMALSLRVYEQGKAVGATLLRLEEYVDVAGARWHLHATVWDDYGTVKGGGHLCEGVTAFQTSFGTLIFGESEERKSNRFEFDVPVGWLQAAAAASDPRATPPQEEGSQP
jgi:hypothetical protein